MATSTVKKRPRLRTAIQRTARPDTSKRSASPWRSHRGPGRRSPPIHWLAIAVPTPQRMTSHKSPVEPSSACRAMPLRALRMTVRAISLAGKKSTTLHKTTLAITPRSPLYRMPNTASGLRAGAPLHLAMGRTKRRLDLATRRREARQLVGRSPPARLNDRQRSRAVPPTMHAIPTIVSRTVGPTPPCCGTKQRRPTTNGQTSPIHASTVSTGLSAPTARIIPSSSARLSGRASSVHSDQSPAGYAVLCAFPSDGAAELLPPDAAP